MSELDEVDGLAKRLELQKVLSAWEAFMQSVAYPYYVKARQDEIDQLKMQIVTIDPVDRKDEIELFKMRGDLRTTEEFLQLFEETAASLRDRIDTLVEAEQPSSNQK